MPQAIDAIDEACRMHDYCYEENGYLTQGCNLVLSYDLMQIVVNQKSSPQQRLDAVLMAAVFFIESQTLDLGVLARNEAIELKNRILGSISQGVGTLENAIKREMRARGAFIP
jgi:hypothetical protein